MLNVLDDMLDQSLALPFSGGRCVVDAEKVRDLIDDLRVNIPDEIQQAKAIVAERVEIIGNAKREAETTMRNAQEKAETTVRKAQEKAAALVARDEIVRIAEKKAGEIMSQAQSKAREIRAGSQDFSDDILRVTEDSLTNALNELRSTRQALGRAGRR